jgi:hypothetical protein
MRMIPGLGGVEIGVKLWRKLRALDPGAAAAAWFARRFANAATLVVDRWGPGWAKRRIGNHGSVGAWALLMLWLGLPILVMSRLW